MKKMFKMSMVLMAVLMVAGSVWAFDLYEHVSQAPNGKGDVLIIPQYIALQGGWNTRITVINTCPSESVVAKVIIRSGGYTKELLDFFIFLTPADVWTGDISYGPNGPRIVSYDDSVIRDVNLNFADATHPFIADFVDVCPGDVINWGIPGDQIGYVEIIEAWNYNETWGGKDFSTPGLDKPTLMKAFFTDTGFAPYGSAGTIGTISDFDEVANVLAAHYEISLPGAGMFAANQATILQNFNVDVPIGIGLETRMDGDSSRNSLCEVEAALSKTRVAMPYYAGTSGIATLGWMTFPTKYTQTVDCDVDDVLSPFFQENAIDTALNPYTIQYGLKWYDLSENSPSRSNFTSPVAPEDNYYFPYEVNIIERIITISYNMGWANIEFADGNGTYDTICSSDRWPVDDIYEVGFMGAPVIPTTMFLASGRLDMMKAAYHDGFVYEEDVVGVTYPLDGTDIYYQPLYQVDWTKTGYGGPALTNIYCDINHDGTYAESCGIFCETRPPIVGCDNFVPAAFAAPVIP